MYISLLILVRIAANPLSNLFQKKLVQDNANPLFVIFVTHAFLTLAAIPLLQNIFTSSLPPEYFFYMILCAVFAVSSNALLVLALKYGDLSMLGPVNSYKPIVGMLFGIFLINEFPGLAGLSGVILILAGSYFITDNTKSSKRTNFLKNFFNDKGVQFRIAALILSGTEAVFLKKALMYSPSLPTFGIWCIAGFLISGLALPFFMKEQFNYKSDLLKKKFTFMNLFITTGLMQLCTLLVFERFQVSYALALFQTSTLLSLFLGYKYFEEKNIKRRLIGSLFMIAGSILIIIYGK